MVRKASLLTIIAVLLLTTAVTAIETRVRVSQAILYNNFSYSGRNWLEGTATSLTTDTLTLRMNSGSGFVIVPLSWMTEIQTRDTPLSQWVGLVWPQSNRDLLRVSVGLSLSTAQLSVSEKERTWRPSVAYVEEDGTEVLTIGNGVPSTIDDEVRTKFGLFANIEHFESARYVRLRDGSFAVRLVTYDENGLSHTAVKPVSEAGLRELSVRSASIDQEPSPAISAEATASPPQPAAISSAAPTAARRFIYGGGAYHFVPESDFSQNLETLGLKIDGANTRAGSIGVMVAQGWSSFVDLGISTYGVKDRRLSSGEILEAEFTVKSLEAAWHRAVTLRPMVITLFTGLGAALVEDHRHFGSIVDIDDEITAWPYSIGVRLISSRQHNDGFAAFAEIRYRWLPLEFRSSSTGHTTDFQLGGIFVQLGAGYWF